VKRLRYQAEKAQRRAPPLPPAPEPAKIPKPPRRPKEWTKHEQGHWFRYVGRMRLVVEGRCWAIFRGRLRHHPFMGWSNESDEASAKATADARVKELKAYE